MAEIKATREMSDDIRKQLDHLKKDYLVVQGKPFEHFFCPMLLKDEDVQLCMGHVVNEKIPNSSGIRVVQRHDVDSFYGTVFESDFITILKAQAAKPEDALFDHDLNKRLKPQFVVDGEVCPHYVYQGTTLPPEHTAIQLEHPDREAIHLVLKKRPGDFMADCAKNWEIVIERDCRITALVSCIKAAYLTLFRLLGYRYALAGAGIEVGHNILGNFYSQHCHMSVDEARTEARRWFRPYVNMMRPIDNFSGTAPRGTIEDGVAMVCFGSSGKPFGQVVCIRTNDVYQAVLLPAYDNPESAAAYFDFLNNDNETLAVNYCQFDAKDRCWHGNDQPMITTWPKRDVSFQFE
jgi:hypothetical protein